MAAARALAVIPAPVSGAGLTLYELEEQLAALVETQAGGIPPELEQQFLTELEATLKSTADKRDRVGQFLNHLEAQKQFADAEIRRLEERRARLAAALERLEAYVIRVIQGLGMEKGKYRKLEGNTITLRIQRCPDSVEVADAAAVPLDYQKAEVTLPAALWEPILDQLDFDFRVQVNAAIRKIELDVSKTAIKAAIDAGAEVPGARLVKDKYTLRRS
jgi:hypothetical protein